MRKFLSLPSEFVIENFLKRTALPTFLIKPADIFLGNHGERGRVGYPLQEVTMQNHQVSRFLAENSILARQFPQHRGGTGLRRTRRAP